MTAVDILAALLMLECVVLGGAKVLALPLMQKRAAHAGFTTEQFRGLGALELLAAAGLGLGVAVPTFGVLAACGLLLLLGGAFATHVRAGDRPSEIAPSLLVAALVAGYLVALVLSQ